MQRRIRDGDTANGYRRQPGNRRNGAGAADLHFNILHHGERLFRWKFMCYREAWRTRHKTEFLLLGDAIDLVHDTIDFVRQVFARSADTMEKFKQPTRAFDDRTLTTYRHADLKIPVEQAAMRGWHLGAFQQPDAVGKKTQRTLRGNAWIQLPQAAGRRIARVRKFLQSRFALSFVELVQIRFEHHYLATNVNHLGRVVGTQTQRDGAHGANIGGHIFTRRTVAAGGCLDQNAVLVTQIDRETIELQVGRIFDLFVSLQTFFYAAIECNDVAFVKTVAERKHRYRVTYLCELRQRCAAHTLSRRIRTNQVRMGGFQFLQLEKQLVVFRIGNSRIVEHIIRMTVPIQFSSKPDGACWPIFCGWGWYRGCIRSLSCIGEQIRQHHQLNKRKARVDPAGIAASSMWV